MITRGIREFVGRDWQAVRESKDSYWAERIARMGAPEAFRIADQLRQQVLLCHPAWPNEAARSEDLEAHARLAALFHRADPTRRP